MIKLSIKVYIYMTNYQDINFTNKMIEVDGNDY